MEASLILIPAHQSQIFRSSNHCKCFVWYFDINTTFPHFMVSILFAFNLHNNLFYTFILSCFLNDIFFQCSFFSEFICHFIFCSSSYNYLNQCSTIVSFWNSITLKLLHSCSKLFRIYYPSTPDLCLSIIQLGVLWIHNKRSCH